MSNHRARRRVLPALGISAGVVAGAIGYGLRTRGFSEPVHAE